MSIFRKPLGTYTRSTPDWFSPLTCAGFGFCQAGIVGAAPAVGLYNDDSQGRSLYVFGLGGSAGFNEVLNFSFFKGTLFKQYFSGTTYNIDPTQGQLPGQIWIGLTAAQFATPEAVNQQGLYLLGDRAGGGDATQTHLLSEHPLAIVRPGYSFAAWCYGSIVQAWFQFVALSY